MNQSHNSGLSLASDCRDPSKLVPTVHVPKDRWLARSQGAYDENPIREQSVLCFVLVCLLFVSLPGISKYSQSLSLVASMSELGKLLGRL